MIQLARVYDSDRGVAGKRFLVERLWPRGIKKANLKFDAWLKEAAPSTELRKWFSHDPDKWAEFQTRYRQELKSKGEQLAVLREKAAKGPVTLLYGAKDEAHNEAVVLLKLLQSKRKRA